LANRTLALHLPGGRQLFVTTGGALWTQQRSSGVCYKRKRKVLPNSKGNPFSGGVKYTEDGESCILTEMAVYLGNGTR